MALAGADHARQRLCAATVPSGLRRLLKLSQFPQGRNIVSPK
jgi:hypothetical protein